MPVYKKAEDRPETRYLLDDAKVFPDHVRGMIGSFQVNFKKDEVTTRVEYRDVKAKIREWNDERNQYSEAKVVLLPVLEFQFTYRLSRPLVNLSGEILEATMDLLPVAKVSVGGQNQQYEGAPRKYGGLEGDWFNLDKGLKKMSFDASFSRKLNRDFEMFSKTLFLVVESDPNVQPYKGELSIKMNEYRRMRELAVQFADRVERIGESHAAVSQEDFIPVLKEAREKGALTYLEQELHSRSLQGRGGMSDGARKARFIASFMISTEIDREIRKLEHGDKQGS